MSTSSCSTSRRASSTALSGVESEPPYTISIGWPAIVGAVHALGRVAALRGRAAVDEGEHRPAPGLALERGEGALVVREDADLDRPRRLSCRRSSAAVVAAVVVWPAPSSSPPHPAASAASASASAASRIQSRCCRPSSGSRICPPFGFYGGIPACRRGSAGESWSSSSFGLGDGGLAGRLAASVSGSASGSSARACRGRAGAERRSPSPDAHQPAGREQDDRRGRSTPMTVLKRAPISSMPRIQLSSAAKPSAPTQAPSSR